MQASTQVASSSSPANRRESKTTPDTKESAVPNINNKSDGQLSQPKHQRLVFTDPIALRYLEEDRSTVVLHRRLTLQGYEIYIVEQWACSRIHPTFVITTYTGDPSHTVVVGVLSVPTDETTWSPRLKLYFNAMAQYHARKNETPLGIIMVTDLGTFPSALTVIPVSGGDLKKHREDFIVNENLKRLGCAGRAGLKLQYPPAATEAKFHLLYRTSERVPLYTAVIELVKQCQVALMIFDKLGPEYVDGLLCDVTETAISDWWTDIGTDLYNVEPNDGVLGPTTVAALLGALLGARNRLHAFGAPVSKDAFDISNLKRGIGSFQKSAKLERTRRLDRQTLDKLHRVTAKAANADRWTGAVKTTVAELGGKGGEMVMGMVGGREKAGIADIETLDMDNFVNLVTGETAKWLWLGKPRKSGLGEGFASARGAGEMMFTKDDQGGYIWTSRKKRSNEDMGADRSFQGQERSWKQPDSSPGLDERDQNLGRMVRKGVSGKVSDARIGFGRFKGAVGLQGLRSHSHKHTKEGSVDLVGDATYFPSLDSEIEKDEADLGNPAEHDFAVHDAQAQARDEDELARPPGSDMKPLPEINIEMEPHREGFDLPRKASAQSTRLDEEGYDLDLYKTLSTEISNDGQQQTPALAVISLRRPQSCADLSRIDSWKQRDNYYWPRHLSFSTVEDVMLGRKGFQGNIQEKPDAGLEEAVFEEGILASDAQIISSEILELSQDTVPWVERQVESVKDLNQMCYDRYEELNSFYLQRLGEYQRIREKSSYLLAEENSYLTDRVKRVELLGAKLDYELDALESKIEDFEAGLDEFEQHVVTIETRIKTLVNGEEEKKESSSWFSWFGKLTAGLTAKT